MHRPMPQDAVAPRFRYIPALDGVRALAIVLVVLSHSVHHTEGGGIGVQIFFALSGFLITSLLLEERAKTGSVSYRNFYVRRALRLLPALAAMLMLVALLPNVYVDPLRDGTSEPRYYTIPLTLFYVANFANAFDFHMGYLAHAWSLSIEEQFYFLWPVAAIWLATTRRFARWLLPLVLLFAMVRLAMYLAHVRGVVDLLPSQADQLLLGAGLAWIARDGLPRWTGRLVAGWAALIVLGVLTLIGTATHQGMQGPIALCGALTICGGSSVLLIAHLLTASRGLVRVFAWRPVVWVGRVSYGIYLFHFPIFQYVAHQRLSYGRTLVIEYAVLAAAVLVSWFVIEQPALRLKRRFEPRVRAPVPHAA